MRVISVSHPNTLVYTSFGKVYVGPRFHDLTDLEKRALLLHEEGHLRHHHQLKRFLAIVLALFKGASWYYAFCRRQELEADRYSVIHGGGFGLLEFFMRYGKTGGDDPYYPGDDERVIHIARCMCEDTVPWEG